MTKAELIDFYLRESKGKVGVELMSLLRNLRELDDLTDKKPFSCRNGVSAGDFAMGYIKPDKEPCEVCRTKIDWLYQNSGIGYEDRFIEYEPNFCPACGRQLGGGK